MTHKIYAPNVHLFAFHLLSDSGDRLLDGVMWEKCREIFTKFYISDQLKIREVPEGDRVDLLEGASDENILLPLEGKISTASGETPIGGSACPLQIYDSFALWLNLWIPRFNQNNQQTEEVETSFFQHFNPDGCFLRKNINSELGQTLLLTAWLSPEDRQKKLNHWRAIATECVQKFLNEPNAPQLYQAGYLFDSPLFEYGDPTQPGDRGTIFVWLFFPEANTEETFNYFDQEFIDLFFYRQKVLEAYRLSREVYRDIRQKYETIKQTIKDIAPKLPKAEPSIANSIESLSETDLNDFKYKLRTLPQLDLEYADLLEELERYGLTIKVNSINYNAKLRKIKEKSPNDDVLSAFQKISHKFQEQIKVDLGYFGSRSGLVDKAIASIRGLVDIEQAERDRALQNTIQAVGAGIGAGVGAAGVIATSYALIKPEDRLLLPGNKDAKSIHPFVASIFWSLLIGVGLGLFIWWRTKLFLNKKAQNESDSSNQSSQTN